MRYSAMLKREALWKVYEIKEKKEDIIDSDNLEDMRKANLLKEEAQEMENEKNKVATRRLFAKMLTEGEKPTV